MRLLLATGLLAAAAFAPAAVAGPSPCDTVAAIHDSILTDRWWHCP